MEKHNLKIPIVASLFLLGVVVLSPSFVFAVDMPSVDPDFVVQQAETQLRELSIALVAIIIGAGIGIFVLFVWILHHHHHPHTLS